MTALERFVTDRESGAIRRGALARVADHLHVSKTTVKRWLNGEWKPGKEKRVAIREMISQRIELSAKRPTGRPRKSLIASE